MDGVGLHEDNPETNPLAKAEMPNLQKLLGGNRLVEGVAPYENDQVKLLALDPNMGVEGLPQSATGQAALLTGKNVPQIIGKHYGPKPNPPVRDVIAAGSIFSELRGKGYSAALLNAYPQPYFDGINSGKRLYSAIPQAVTNAGIALMTKEDLDNGRALAADFTGAGWRKHLGYEDSPVMNEHQAGVKLAKLAMSYDFSFFEYWPSDYAGHRQDHEGAVDLLESFDGVLGGLLETWKNQEGLILLTSDHGNMEDLSTRRHTDNCVPGLVIGSKELRDKFTQRLETLADVAPAITQFYS